MRSYWEEGLYALSVNEICRRAAISKPGLYREFGGEDGLLVAVLNHYRDTVLGPRYSLISEDRPFAEVLAEVLHWATQELDTPAGCLFAKMRSSTPRLGPATAARVVELKEEMHVVYAAWYQRAIDHGEVDASIPTALAAHYIDTQLTTVLIQMAEGVAPDLIRAQARIAFASLLPS